MADEQEVNVSCGNPREMKFLWNIYYYGVLRLELPEGIDLNGYADDRAVVTRGRNRSELESGLDIMAGLLQLNS